MNELITTFCTASSLIIGSSGFSKQLRIGVKTKLYDNTNNSNPTALIGVRLVSGIKIQFGLAQHLCQQFYYLEESVGGPLAQVIFPYARPRYSI